MFEVTTAAQRKARLRKMTAVIWGKSGVGKTTLARQLDPKTTLFIDLEAGVEALAEWEGDSFDVLAVASQMGAHPWEITRAIACYISGPDPAETDANKPYSLAMYNSLKPLFANFPLEKYQNYFLDSITVASRHCFSWSQTQPEAFSEKKRDASGKPVKDMLGAYGLTGLQMVDWFTRLQHGRASVFLVGILNEEVDDLKRVTYKPQMEGKKSGNEIGGIFDQVFTLRRIGEGLSSYRALVCREENQWNLPAKDRSGCLEELEPPDLRHVINKIRAGKRLDTIPTTTLPTTSTTTSPAVSVNTSEPALPGAV